MSEATKKTTKAAPKAENKESKVSGDPMHSMFSGKYYYSNGKRKTSIARVRLYEKGEGKIVVNGKDVSEYFSAASSSIELLKSPFKLTSTDKDFNVTVKVSGGGIFSQADAVRHGIAKALVVFNESNKSTLKKEGQITRDSRTKERKKPGLKRARKAPTWVKR